MIPTDPFTATDRLRRMVGTCLDAAGLGPLETPSRLVHVQPGFELLGYAEPGRTGPAMLLVPAPIKRAYIWDLAPAVSVVRRCLERQLRVYVMSWTEPAEPECGLGLAQYGDKLIADAIAAIEAETGERRVVLAGHSLGGTFAAIFAALRPEMVSHLVLLEAPLRFGFEGSGAFAPLVTAACSVATPLAKVPGTLLSLAASTFAPDAFVWERWIDLLTSASDPEQLVLHYRVERWTFDELPISGCLVRDVLEALYRDDRFMRHELTLGGRDARPERVTAPMIVVVNPRSRVVPAASILPFVELAGSDHKMVLEYSGEPGVSLQHVGVLVGGTAHRCLWPLILDRVVRQQ